MLVLSRKTDEKIYIGDNICITILHTKGNRVRIGVEAPPEVRVLRGELPSVKTIETDSSPKEISECDEDVNVGINLFAGADAAEPESNEFIPLRETGINRFRELRSTSLKRAKDSAEEIVHRTILPIDGAT